MPAGYRAWSIENPDALISSVGSTFHGRDVFAPAAAQVSDGLDPGDLGPELNEIVCLNLPGPEERGGLLVGHIQYTDRFGNLATDFPSAEFGDRVDSMAIRMTTVRGVSATYRSVGRLGCVRASHGFLELASRGGSAAEITGAVVGDEVRVRLKSNSNSNS